MTTVLLKTNKGDIKLELFDNHAPKTVRNFVGLATGEIDAVLGELRAERRDVTEISAAMVAIVAARAIAARRELTSPEPLYLRAPDVTLPAPRKRVGS